MSNYNGVSIVWKWKRIFLVTQVFAICTITNLALPSANAAPNGPGKGPPGQECNIHVVLEDATQAMWDAAYKKCPRPKVHYPAIATALKDFDVDDKCYNKCLYTELGVMSGNEKVKKGVVATIFKGNMTAQMTSKTTNIWDTCVDECEKAMEKKADKPCMIFPMHMFCYQKKVVQEKVYTKC